MLDSIGQLNKRIEFVKISNVINEGGYPIPEEKTLGSCFAAVEDGSYRTNEHYAAALGRVAEIVSFTVRYKVAKKYDVREGMYIRFEGELYRIIARPYDATHDRRYVKLNAEAVGEVSG